MSYNPSYSGALEAAGAKVLAYSEFGSYQGDWFALVEYQGQTGWVLGSYGSCSGCDAFQAEFEVYSKSLYRMEFDEETRQWDYIWSPEGIERLKVFGESYLRDLRSNEEILDYAKEHLSWDMEGDKVVKWLEACMIIVLKLNRKDNTVVGISKDGLTCFYADATEEFLHIVFGDKTEVFYETFFEGEEVRFVKETNSW